MPPEEEKQPSATEKKVITDWINNGLKKFIAEASSKEAAPTLRRLTNFEYQNTMRDLLGFEMDFTKSFPVVLTSALFFFFGRTTPKNPKNQQP